MLIFQAMVNAIRKSKGLPLRRPIGGAAGRRRAQLRVAFNAGMRHCYALSDRSDARSVPSTDMPPPDSESLCDSFPLSGILSIPP